MKKTVLLIFILITLTARSQWKQNSNAEYIKAHQKEIRDFVITEDSRYIYTLDTTGIIKKWDYATGDSLSSRKVEPVKGDYQPPNWIFLSSDAKTFCVSKFRTALGMSDGNNYCNVYIFNMEDGKILDSIQYLYHDGNLSQINSLNTININFESNKYRLIISIYYDVEFFPFYAGMVNSGSTSIHIKDNNQWVTKKSYKGEPCLILKANDILFLSTRSSFSTNEAGDQSHYTVEYTNNNFVFNIANDSIKSLCSYYKKHVWNANPDIESGRKIACNSGFYSNDGETLIISELNNIYRYILKSEVLDSFKLVNYPNQYPLKLSNSANDDFFLIIQDNLLQIHEINSLKNYNTFAIDGINRISILKHSIDKQYIFCADKSGSLFRIKTSGIFKLWANFMSPDTNICVGNPVNFYDRSIGYPDTFLWDFGDGSTSTKQNPTHVFTNTGLYDIKQIVSKNGIYDTIVKSKYIDVLPILKADFDFQYSGTNPVKVSFTDKSTGTIDSVLWDFDDSTESIIQNPEHDYLYSGDYNVRLIVHSKTLSDTTTKVVTIVIKELAIDKSKIQYEFTDTTHSEGGIAIKGWEEEGGSLMYHIAKDSIYHHGAFSNFSPQWEETKTIGKEFFLRRTNGVYTYLTDTLIINLDKKGNELQSGYYLNTKNIISVKTVDNSLIPSYIKKTDALKLDKLTFDELDDENNIILTKELRGVNNTGGNVYYYEILNFIASKTDSLYDYSASICVGQESGMDYPPYLSHFYLDVNNNDGLPFVTFNDFIRLNDSLLVLGFDKLFMILKGKGLNLTKYQGPDCKIIINKSLPGYIFESLLKLNDTAFIAAGSFSNSPAYFIISSNGNIIDSVVLDNRTGNFKFVSLTPDYNLLLSGYRIKYFKYKSPYFVKTNDPLIRSLCLSAEEPPISEKNSLLYNLNCTPNPVFGNAVISFTLKESVPIKLKIYDVYGSVVITHSVREYSAGTNIIDVSFNRLPIGSYYYVLDANNYIYSGKIAYLRQ